MSEYEKTVLGGSADSVAQMQLPPTLRIFLSFTAGPLKGKKVRLTKTIVTVGRKPPADIVIPDPTVSSAHALFEIFNEDVTLKDNDSTNGTLVNGQKIKKAKVNNMDEIGFGDSRALLTIVQDTYGLYAEDEEEADSKVDWRVSDVPRIQPYEHCLIAGYNAWQMGSLRTLVEEKKLAKLHSAVLNGAEFMETAGKAFREQKPVDLIITEIKMPVLNGVQCCVAFRSFERGFGLKTVAPIVLLTEAAPDQNIQKTVEYLKPCKYLQSSPDRAEFERRANALIDRLLELGSKRK